jgi:hypothetical protein
MAKPRTKDTTSQESDEQAPSTAREQPTDSSSLPASIANEGSSDKEGEGTKKYVDPRSEVVVNLSGHRGGPSMHLLRSWKFKQLQVRFDGEQPGTKYLAMLKEAGWTDRTESEGIWTKQVALGEWRPVVEAERVFKTIANGIRADKGLEPLNFLSEPNRPS